MTLGLCCVTGTEPTLIDHPLSNHPFSSWAGCDIGVNYWKQASGRATEASLPPNSHRFRPLRSFEFVIAAMIISTLNPVRNSWCCRLIPYPFRGLYFPADITAHSFHFRKYWRREDQWHSPILIYSVETSG